jgi:hypothetical protein
VRDIKINLGHEIFVRRVSLENQNFNQPFLPAAELVSRIPQDRLAAWALFACIILSRLSGTATISLLATVRNSKEDFRSNHSDDQKTLLCCLVVVAGCAGFGAVAKA